MSCISSVKYSVKPTSGQSESGINDGAGTPYFLLFLLPLVSKHPAKDYLLEGILWETVFPIFGGFLVGTVFRIAWSFAKKREWVDKESRLVWTIALALFTLGLVSTLRFRIACGMDAK